MGFTKTITLRYNVGPLVASWFVRWFVNPMNTMAIFTISYIYWSYKPT